MRPIASLPYIYVGYRTVTRYLIFYQVFLLFLPIIIVIIISA